MSNELLITDDFGDVHRCQSEEDLLKVSEILISASPDYVAMDAASPDMTNYNSEFGLHYMGISSPLVDAGFDLYGFMVKRLKEAGIRVLANIRMNDHHGRPAYWTPWEREHVAWSLGEDTGARDWKSIGALRHMDYAIEGVRSYRLSIVEEILDRYQVDGIQLDFGRTAPFVSEPKREKGQFMTDFIQSVRLLLDKSGPDETNMILGTLLPWDIDYCHAEGLEVNRWVSEGFVNYLSPGEWYYADWNIPQQAWVDLTKGTGCKFYPFTPGNVSSYQDFENGDPSLLGENRLLDGSKIRAIADNYVNQGLDGFAFYNFYTFDFGHFYPELRTWVNPQKSKELSRHYLNCRSLMYHATERDSYDLGIAFERSSLGVTDDEALRPFRFSSDLSGKKAVLRCAFSGMNTGDKIEVQVNGITIAPTSLEKSGEESQTTTWEGDMNSPPLNIGENVLSLKLVKASDQRTTPIKVGEFEIIVEAGSE
jgi:hypothetical protein